MARALLALQSLTNAGLEATYTAATVDGHAFDNRSERVFLHVKNAAGVDTTVTIETPNSYAGLALPDRTVVVTAGEERFIGPFPKFVFNQTLATPALRSGVKVNAAPQASVTYAAIKMD